MSVLPEEPAVSVVPGGIAGHVGILREDARALAACVGRLGAIEEKLLAGGAAPQWLHEAINAHRTACAEAATDLATASDLLENYAERT